MLEVWFTDEHGESHSARFAPHDDLSQITSMACKHIGYHYHHRNCVAIRRRVRWEQLSYALTLVGSASEAAAVPTAAFCAALGVSNHGPNCGLAAEYLRTVSARGGNAELALDLSDDVPPLRTVKIGSAANFAERSISLSGALYVADAADAAGYAAGYAAHTAGAEAEAEDDSRWSIPLELGDGSLREFILPYGPATPLPVAAAAAAAITTTETSQMLPPPPWWLAPHDDAALAETTTRFCATFDLSPPDCTTVRATAAAALATEIRRRPGPPPPIAPTALPSAHRPFIFFHVRKCGGTSLREAIWRGALRHGLMGVISPCAAQACQYREVCRSIGRSMDRSVGR